jgi:hypothetical protein
MSIPGTMPLEWNIQDCFADLYLHHEWFRADPRLVAFIDGLKAGRPLHEIIDLNARRGNLRAHMYERRSELIRQRKAA